MSKTKKLPATKSRPLGKNGKPSTKPARFGTIEELRAHIEKHQLKVTEQISVKGKMYFNVVDQRGRVRTLRAPSASREEIIEPERGGAGRASRMAPPGGPIDHP